MMLIVMQITVYEHFMSPVTDETNSFIAIFINYNYYYCLFIMKFTELLSCGFKLEMQSQRPKHRRNKIEFVRNAVCDLLANDIVAV